MTCRPFRPFPSPTRRLHQPALRNLGRPDSRFPPAVGTVCGCSWDIMGSYGGQWEWIVKPWNIRALRRSSRHSGVFLEQNEIALLAPPRANAMLARQWGEMMFFFCSPDRSGRAKLGRAAVGRGKSARRPVSRVLSRPLAGPWMTIPLGRPLPDASRDLPGRRRRKPAWPAPVPKDRPAGRPYSVLLPVGFTMPLPLPAARCALTAPFHPYRRPRLTAGAGGLLSVALSLGSPPPGVTRHRVSVEPGLSSPRPRRVEERPSSRLAAVS